MCNTPIRIGFLIDTISCDTSGTEKQLLEIIRRIDRKKYEPLLICLSTSKWLNENQLPCRFFSLSYKGFVSKNIFEVISRLKKIIVDHRINILQTFFEESVFIAFFSTIGLRLKPILVSSRRDIGLGKGNHPWYHQLFWMILPLINMRYEAIITNSKQVGAFVAKRERINEKKIEVIYNGVDLPILPEKKPEIFRKVNHDVWLAIVASLTPVKKHEILIRAIHIIFEKYGKANVGVLVLGKGSEKDYLVQLTNRYKVNNHFHFEGAVQNVTDYLHYVDIGINCSEREGLSNAILEYMSCGLPVVATAAGGNVELVSHLNGKCVPVNEPETLADSIHELMNDINKRRKMGRMSRKMVIDCFSWKRSMQDLDKFYQKMIKGNDA